MPFAEVNSIKMHYEVAGSGPPLVLLHAWPTDHAIWQLQVPVFSQYFQTIAVDLRGCGRSDKPAGPNGPAVMANDVITLLDVLGFERAAVCGISLGGAVAAEMTLDYPERITSAIWIGANSEADSFLISIGSETMLIMDAYLSVLEPEGYLGFWEKIWKANSGLLFNEEFVQSRLGQHLMTSLFEQRYGSLNADPTAIINILHSIRGWTIVDRLPGLSRPVQVVVGDQDPTLVYAEEQGQLAANAEYVLMENSGHFTILDQTARFNELALDFLLRTHG